MGASGRALSQLDRLFEMPRQPVGDTGIRGGQVIHFCRVLHDIVMRIVRFVTAFPATLIRWTKCPN